MAWIEVKVKAGDETVKGNFNGENLEIPNWGGVEGYIKLYW